MKFHLHQNTNGAVDETMNTGNIARQTISFNGLSQPFVQTYKYNSLYRLKEANEKAGTTENWKQDFTYDRYGNRLTHDKFINGNQITHNTQTHPTIDPNTNRFNTGQNYGYDKVGNLVTDANSRTFTFDGNNKQRLVYDGAETIGEYFYDGDGMRVKKHLYTAGTHTKTVIFVYSGGKLIEEYSTDPTQNPKTKYLTEDHLGTPRVITDGNGEVISRRDFMPFGEDLGSTVGTRSTSNFKYASQDDDVRQKFTGYQKDEETQLDFAEARMYESRHARFTAVDPLLASGKSANPQTFNRYVYVGNNPINITDPLGLDWYFDGKSNFKWYDGKPDKGWTAVDFGDGNTFSYQGCFTSACSVTATAYLHKGSEDWNWDVQSALNSISVFNDLNNTNIKLPNDVAIGMGIGARNFARGVGNLPVEIPMFFGTFSLNDIGVPRFFDYEEPANEVQSFSSGLTQVQLSLLTGGATGGARSFIANSGRVNRFFSKAGSAEINHFKISGTNHFSIKTKSRNKTLESHQTLDSNNMTTIEDGFGLPSPTETIKLSLPDVRGAMRRQKSLFGKDTGLYDPKSNSCVTHVCDVLRSGGINAPYDTKSGVRFFRKLRKN